jgi:hypothetical protein
MLVILLQDEYNSKIESLLSKTILSNYHMPSQTKDNKTYVAF